MAVTSIKILLDMPVPEPMPVEERKPEPPKVEGPSVEDKVREALELIDSGHESAIEWSMINRLYRDLSKLKKPNARAKNLIQMIEPVLAKFGYHKVPSNGV